MGKSKTSNGMNDLSIVITHYKTPQLLNNLLKHLKAGGDTAQIIVADSQARPETGLLVRTQFPRVTYIPFADNVGYAKLANAGVRKADRPYILILNADISIDLGDIKKMRSFLALHNDAGALGASAAFRFPTLGAILARRTLWSYTPWGKRAQAHYEMQDYTRQEPRQVDWVRGDCWMLTKNAIDTVGLLDERFFMYLEDTDWCRRAKRAGFSVYFLPGITLKQRQQGSSRKKTTAGLLYRFSHIKSFINYLLKWNH